MNTHHPDGILNFNYFEHKLFHNELDKTMFRMQMIGNEKEFIFKKDNACESPDKISKEGVGATSKQSDWMLEENG